MWLVLARKRNDFVLEALEPCGVVLLKIERQSP